MDGVREPQVDLGLAAAGHAVQEDGGECAARGERVEPFERGRLFLGEDVRLTREGGRQRAVTRRVTFDSTPGHRHQSEFGEAFDRRCANTPVVERSRIDAFWRGFQQFERLALPAPSLMRFAAPDLSAAQDLERRSGDIVDRVMPLRGQRDDARSAMCVRRSFQWLSDPHQAVALQPDQHCVRAAWMTPPSAGAAFARTAAAAAGTFPRRHRRRPNQRVHPYRFCATQRLEHAAPTPRSVSSRASPASVIWA